MSDVPAAIPSVSVTTEDSPDAPDAGISTFIQRPEWVPEKFYDPKTGAVDLKSVLKSYGELEASRSSVQKVDQGAGAPKVEAPKVAEPAAQVTELPTVPGVTPEVMKALHTELTTTGKLADKSYADLATMGYPKAVVDAYLKGTQTDQLVESAVSEARIADTQIAEITASIGGGKVLSDMQSWAKASMTPADLKTYNDSVSSGDVAKVKLAVQGLHYAFTQANGREPNLLSGRAPVGAVDVYASNAEATAAIRDPRYATDEAYRNKVAAKLGRSNVL